MEIAKEELKFLRALLGFALLGFVLLLSTHYFPGEWAIRRLLFASVGEALIVATVLGLTVDLYVKKSITRRTSKDVFKYLVGYNLPDEIKARIQALMGIELIRRNWKINYTLTPIDKDNVLVDVQYTFELENVSNTPQKYRQAFQGEKHLNPLMVEMRCDDPEAKFRMLASSGASLAQDQPGVLGLVQALAPEISVKPSNRDQKLMYPFMGHYQLRTPNNCSDTFSFAHPSIGAAITVSYPAGYRITMESAPDMIVTDNMWQLRNRAFLPSEQITVRWQKTN
jgi:hypothetical protein